MKRYIYLILICGQVFGQQSYPTNNGYNNPTTQLNNNTNQQNKLPYTNVTPPVNHNVNSTSASNSVGSIQNTNGKGLPHSSNGNITNNTDSSTPTEPVKKNPVSRNPQDIHTSSRTTKNKENTKNTEINDKPSLPGNKNVQASKQDTGALNSYFQNSDNATNISSNKVENELPSAWGPFFFLTCLILGIYFVVRWIKKRVYQLKVENNPIDFIKTIATIPVTTNTQLAIVDMAGKYFLFSVSSQSMNLVMEIKDLDILLKIQTLPSHIPETKSFKDVVLELFGKRVSQKVTPTSTEERFKQLINNQKSRIGNMK